MTGEGSLQNSRITGFTNEGLTFSVSDSGPVGGEIVLLLHGFPQTRSAWLSTATELNAAGFRTLAPTLRGYEATSRARGRWRYRSSRIVSDVAALIEQAGGGPVHLVGHDWGALLAWSTAGARPDLVSSLTAISVPHYPAYLLSMLTSSQLVKSYYVVLFQLPAVPEVLFKIFPNSFANRLRGSGMNDKAIEAVKSEVVAAGSLTSAINWYRGLLVSNQRAMSGAVHVPTTFIWGDQDTLLDKKGVSLTRRFVSSKYSLEILPGVSHWVPDERPEEIARIFINNH